MIAILPKTDIETQIQLNLNIELLWQAAYAYETSSICGSAVGMVTMGIINSKPKAIAVKTWIDAIWNLYYTRKALITSTAKIENDQLDFTSCGAMPHTIPELIEEYYF